MFAMGYPCAQVVVQQRRVLVHIHTSTCYYIQGPAKFALCVHVRYVDIAKSYKRPFLN